MKPVKSSMLLVLVLVGAMACGPALARGGHGHGGGARAHARALAHAHPGVGRPVHHHARIAVFVAAPVIWSGLYFRPAYYPAPPVVVVPYAPPRYVEREAVLPVPVQSDGYWYYCAGSNSYYPYVRECPGGWQRVSPQPPPG